MPSLSLPRIRHLRKRSTYLIINLTVADLLVGAVTVPLNLLNRQKENNVFKWVIKLAFPIASQVNLSLISLEWLHATRFPFKHCLITKRLYLKIIVGSWLITFAIAFVLADLTKEVRPYALASFSLLTLLVLTVSYIIVIVNVQRNPHSQNHGSIHMERKLSVTLFIVAAVSVLTILPWAIYKSIPVYLREELLNASAAVIYDMLGVIYYANCIVNPVVYAIRLQEFRKALRNLVSKSTEPTGVNPLQLQTIS